MSGNVVFISLEDHFYDLEHVTKTRKINFLRKRNTTAV